MKYIIIYIKFKICRYNSVFVVFNIIISIIKSNKDTSMVVILLCTSAVLLITSYVITYKHLITKNIKHDKNNIIK